MSFSDAQKREIEFIVQEKIKAIFDAGCIATDKKNPEPAMKEFVLSPTLDSLLKYERDPEGKLWAKVKNHIEKEQFKTVADEISETCGAIYQPGKGWRLPQ